MKPTRRESARREQHFRQLVQAGSSLKHACQVSRIDPYRALAIVETPDFWLQIERAKRDEERRPALALA